MERWAGRVAVVTGASAGIGAAIVIELVKKGMKVVGMARRVDRMEKMKEDLKSAPGELHAVKCDVTKEDEVVAAFDWVTKTLGGVDVLVNNAGVIRVSPLIGGPISDWRQILELNILGLSVGTSVAIKSMRARGVDDGHVFHINSIGGHKVVDMHGTAMYCASKHSVTALTEGLRLELVNLKSRIRVTSISPGAVRTEIWDSSTPEARASFTARPSLDAKDVADAVLYALGAPPHVQIHELTIKPVGSAN